MSKEIAVKETVNFLVLTNKDALAALKNNLEGETLSPRDLDRVSVPAGGGTSWCIPTLSGEETVPEILGVVVGVQNCRAYWAGDFAGGGEPPDCSSDDAYLGVGDPGGNCQACKFAQFGSDSRGKGQACKAIKRFFVVRPTSLLPLMVSFPPTSLKNAKDYLKRLGGELLTYQEVVTKITLAKTKNSDGIAYSIAKFAMGGKLNPGQIEDFEKYKKDIDDLLRRPPAVTANDLSN